MAIHQTHYLCDKVPFLEFSPIIILFHDTLKSPIKLYNRACDNNIAIYNKNYINYYGENCIIIILTIYVAHNDIQNSTNVVCTWLDRSKLIPRGSATQSSRVHLLKKRR